MQSRRGGRRTVVRLAALSFALSFVYGLVAAVTPPPPPSTVGLVATPGPRTSEDAPSAATGGVHALQRDVSPAPLLSISHNESASLAASPAIGVADAERSAPVVTYGEARRALDANHRMSASALAAALQHRKWPSNPERWAASITAFTRADRASPPPPGGIIFIGSSTIRLWRTLPDDFRGLGVIGRGFGGSQLPDSTFYAHKLVAPHRPRQVVLFAGSNDLSAGRSPENIADDFQFFVEVARSLAPQARLSFIEITSSPSRWRQRAAAEATNARIRQLCADLGVDFIPIRDLLLERGGGQAAVLRPRPDYFARDRLHLSPKGYIVLADAVRPFLLPWPALANATVDGASPDPSSPPRVALPSHRGTRLTASGAGAINLEDEDSLVTLRPAVEAP